jgi:hypothetical protein
MRERITLELAESPAYEFEPIPESSLTNGQEVEDIDGLTSRTGLKNGVPPPKVDVASKARGTLIPLPGHPRRTGRKTLEELARKPPAGHDNDR